MNISDLEVGTPVLINGEPYIYNGIQRIQFLFVHTMQHEFIATGKPNTYISKNSGIEVRKIGKHFEIIK